MIYSLVAKIFDAMWKNAKKRDFTKKSLQPRKTENSFSILKYFYIFGKSINIAFR